MTPRRPSLGQHFLADPNMQRRIVQEAGLREEDHVLEVGPGRGALTRLVAGTVRRLVLVELDDALARDLEARYRDTPGVEVLHRDILEVPLTDVEPEPRRLKVLGNIPYGITAPLLFHLLGPPAPREILVMIQREVADRLLAAPGTGEYGALTVGVRTVADVRRVLRVPASVFRPPPRVESAVVRITPMHPPPLDDAAVRAVRRVTRALFQWRRKQLRRILRDQPDLSLGAEVADAVLRDLELAPTARPEELAPGDFVRLARRLAPPGGGE